MRHFLAAPLSISPLALGVREPPVEGRLVPPAGGEHRQPSGLGRAGSPAVPVAAITPDAEKENLAARRPRADHEPE
jgi:hypothetical protein